MQKNINNNVINNDGNINGGLHLNLSARGSWASFR